MKDDFSITDVVNSNEVVFHTSEIHRLVEARMERLEYGLFGAWRAGYAYVDVERPLPADQPLGQIASRRIIPHNDKDRTPPEGWIAERYYLAWVDDDKVLEAWGQR